MFGGIKIIVHLTGILLNKLSTSSEARMPLLGLCDCIISRKSYVEIMLCICVNMEVSVGLRFCLTWEGFRKKHRLTCCALNQSPTEDIIV